MRRGAGTEEADGIEGHTNHLLKTANTSGKLLVYLEIDSVK